jgi:hypothetical protein
LTTSILFGNASEERLLRICFTNYDQNIRKTEC